MRNALPLRDNLNQAINLKALPDLAVWLDAPDISNLTFSSTKIDTIKNKGNKALGNFTQGTDAQRALYVRDGIKGMPSLQGRHDGSNASYYGLADAAALDYTTFHMFIVMQRAVDMGATETVVCKMSSFNSENEIRLLVTGGDTIQMAGTSGGTGGGTGVAATSSSLALGEAAIIEAFYDGTNLYVRKANGSFASVALASIYQGTANFGIFAFNASGEPSGVHMGELLFFTRMQNDYTRKRIRDRLKVKWRLPC